MVRATMRYESRSGAVLYARDINRVAAFYSAVLGLEEEAHDCIPLDIVVSRPLS